MFLAFLEFQGALGILAYPEAQVGPALPSFQVIPVLLLDRMGLDLLDFQLLQEVLEDQQCPGLPCLQVFQKVPSYLEGQDFLFHPCYPQVQGSPSVLEDQQDQLDPCVQELP